jgi:Tol biopolymer transport system component
MRSVELVWALLPTEVATTTRVTGSVSRPRIGPNGTPFIYECGANLCLYAFLGGTRLFATTASREAWSPDGYHVSYDTPNGLCVAEEWKPACGVILAHDESVIIESAWSPDGMYLVLSRGAELWLIQANGENAVRLPLASRVGTSISSPSWSEGGAVVATP